MKIFRSYSSRETAEFGRELARSILKRRVAHGALVIALQGDLGAGKTTFTQGFARGLGIKRRTTSPTFVIMRRFAISNIRGRHLKHFYHIDAYRLKKPDVLEVLGFREILVDPSAIVLLEWPENVKKLLPRKTVWLKFRHGKKENERVVRVMG